MSEEYGAAQPIADLVGKGVNAVRDTIGAIDKAVPDSVVDTFHKAQNVVHDIVSPAGHGYKDQKYEKGNTAPISLSKPK